MSGLVITGSGINWETTYNGGGTTTTGNIVSRGGTSGYVKLEGGMIVQYGKCLNSSTVGRYSNPIYFPISFPNACISLSMCEDGAYGWGNAAATHYSATLIGTSGFYVEGVWINSSQVYYGGNIGGAYIAIGY